MVPSGASLQTPYVETSENIITHKVILVACGKGAPKQWVAPGKIPPKKENIALWKTVLLGKLPSGILPP